MISNTEILNALPGQMKRLEGFNVTANYERDLAILGAKLSKAKVSKMMSVMDSLQPPVTTPSEPVPNQFLQNFLPGFVRVITNKRNIDAVAGLTVRGAFEDSEVVQGIMELLGLVQLYGDFTNTPFTSWNMNWNTFTIVRFEMGMEVTNLEQLRSSKINVDSAAAKRDSCALQLEINRNLIGFYGFNNGLNRTYGYLTDPGLPAYLTAANGVSGSPLWANKTYLEIINDIRRMAIVVQTQSGDNVNPEKVPMMLSLATADYGYLSKISDVSNGYSVRSWIRDTYPLMQIESSPELTAANGGANVAYMYPIVVDDDSTDDGRVFAQEVPVKFLVEGVLQGIKGYQEGYASATAGVFCKRPWAVVRLSGI